MTQSPTRIQDIYDPEVLSNQVSAKFPTELVFSNLGVVSVDGEFPLGTPGSEFTIPFDKQIAALSDFSENTEMDTNRLTTGNEKATVLRGGGAYEVLDTALMVAKQSPIESVSGQLARRVAEYIDGKLITEVEKSPNTFNQFNGSEQTVNTGKCDQNTFLAAMIAKLGDQHGAVLMGGYVIIHSKVYSDLLQTGAVQEVQKSGLDNLVTGRIRMINGLNIHVSDRVTTSTISSTTAYKSYIVGPGALGLFYQREAFVEFERLPRRKSSIIAVDVNFAPHLFGYDDNTSAVVAESNKSILAVVVTSK